MKSKKFKKLMMGDEFVGNDGRPSYKVSEYERFVFETEKREDVPLDTEVFPTGKTHDLDDDDVFEQEFEALQRLASHTHGHPSLMEWMENVHSPSFMESLDHETWLEIAGDGVPDWRKTLKSRIDCAALMLCTQLISARHAGRTKKYNLQRALKAYDYAIRNAAMAALTPDGGLIRTGDKFRHIVAPCKWCGDELKIQTVRLRHVVFSHECENTVFYAIRVISQSVVVEHAWNRLQQCERCDNVGYPPTADGLYGTGHCSQCERPF
jgi:hypothetical protein